jgi:hypothetical protein
LKNNAGKYGFDDGKFDVNLELQKAVEEFVTNILDD